MTNQRSKTKLRDSEKTGYQSYDKLCSNLGLHTGFVVPISSNIKQQKK